MSASIRFISAGAGSGKTYRLTEVLKDALTESRVRPGAVIGTTFTKKAAAELRERVRRHLFEAGQSQLAIQMGQALLGTVNSVCGQLLARFAFEVGLSPDLEVIPEEESQTIFDQLVETVVDLNCVCKLNEISYRLDLDDWKAVVKSIVDAARANDMGTEAMRQFGAISADELLGYFPRQKKKDLFAELLSAIDKAIKGIESSQDETKGTKSYLEDLKKMRPNVAEKRLRWSEWVRLGKQTPTKRSLSLAEKVQEAALQYEAHPLLHQDIRQLCETVFILAADALAAYQEFKAKRGLIDFVDQEQLLLKALDLPTVSSVLKDELDLLLVDEFQDTSPIQLALFLKLADVATETVFVGDVKQAIYGFRGSDPELMQAVLAAVEKQGGRTEVLNKSYRSRKPLVEYANAVFITAFKDSMKPEKVRLVPVRTDPSDMANDTAVEKWVLKGRNVRLHALATGQGIIELVNSGRRVTDSATKTTRAVRYLDIAVFARTHDHVEALAEAFADLGIPVNMERGGLLATPEACLVLACLRRLADPSDTLASAEVVALSSNQATETWLNHRLQYLDAGGDSYRWGEDGSFPLLQRLAQSRERLQFLTPSEAIAFAVDLADLRRIVVAWGPTTWRGSQRLKNLDGLVDLAKQYEEHCRAQHLAASVGGLLIWLDSTGQAKMDLQPKDASGDAVHLLTHHGAKGLEWPVVIATDLVSEIRTRLWGLSVVADTDIVDLSKPLACRHLRYWPWPFGKQKTGIAVADEVAQSKVGCAAALREKEEAKRLLYVSLTRARDLLVLPFAETKFTGPWIDCLNAAWMVPSADKLALPNKSKIPTKVREYEAAEGELVAVAYKPFWFDKRAAPTPKLPKFINPSGLPGMESARILSTEKIGKCISIKGHPDMNALGEALHAALAAELICPAHSDHSNLVQDLIDSKGLSANVKAGDVARYMTEFSDFLKTRFKPKKVWAEHPMVHVWENGQVANGWIDVLIETDKGWIVIDHKISWGKPDAIVRKYAGQIAEYENAVEAAVGGKVQSSWIHLPLAGEVILLNIY